MLSVIVPIYNTGKYLDKCISSITQQTYSNLEIILVNDCSSDKRTNEIIQDWVKKDRRIILIDKTQNEGVDSARVSGINASTAPYIAFVDSDDWLPENAFQLLMDKVNEYDCDIVNGNIANYWFGGILKRITPLVPELINRIIFHEELMDKYYLSYFGVNIIPVSMNGKVYKKSLFEKANIQPSRLRFGEDLVMNMTLFPFVQKFYFTENIVYNYRQGLPTMSGKYLDNWLPNFRKLYQLKIAKIQEYNYSKAIYYQEVELVNYLKSYVTGCLRHKKNEKENCIKLLEEELKYPIFRDLSALKTSSYPEQELVDYILQGEADNVWNYITLWLENQKTWKSKCTEFIFQILSRIIR